MPGPSPIGVRIGCDARSSGQNAQPQPFEVSIQRAQPLDRHARAWPHRRPTVSVPPRLCAQARQHGGGQACGGAEKPALQYRSAPHDVRLIQRDGFGEAYWTKRSAALRTALRGWPSTIAPAGRPCADRPASARTGFWSRNPTVVRPCSVRRWAWHRESGRARGAPPTADLTEPVRRRETSASRSVSQACSEGALGSE
jgi:hypothetical protein